MKNLLQCTYVPVNHETSMVMPLQCRPIAASKRGGRAAWKQFHDELMRYGGPPIPLVRRAMLGPNDRGPLF